VAGRIDGGLHEARQMDAAPPCPSHAVIPAKAGIQFRAAASTLKEKPDSRLRE
jgi:hypothetical protein